MLRYICILSSTLVVAAPAWAEQPPFVPDYTYEGAHVSMWEEAGATLPFGVVLGPNEKGFGASVSFDSDQSSQFGPYRRTSFGGVINCTDKTARLTLQADYFDKDEKSISPDFDHSKFGDPEPVETGRFSGDVYNYLCK